MTADRNAGIFASSTETPPRSRSRIFTYRKMKIATSPFVYRGAHVFMPEKLGNLQPVLTVGVANRFDPYNDINVFRLTFALP